MTKTNNYQICTKCIMDTTDPEITFDENGVCNHCRRYIEEKVKERLFLDKAGQEKLDRLIEKIKIEGRNKKYDCIIGASGGMDSTYVIYLVKKMGLRPLAVHLDNGWNAEIAENNLKNAFKKLNIDLHIIKTDLEEFRDLQISFLKASVPDAEIPTDHAISAALYQIAVKERVPYIFTGVNIMTEGIHPLNWSYGLWDWKYIKSVHKKFGKINLKIYPHYSLFGFFYYLFIKRIKRIPLLNYIKYVKKDVIEIMEKELGWQYYGGKHYESIYTRFVQAYILPKKFNIDKRKAHLSSLICSGQITREEALGEMDRNPYPSEEMLQQDKEFILKRLEFTEEEFEKIMSLPTKTVKDYPSNYWLFPLMRKLARKLKIVKFL